MVPTCSLYSLNRCFMFRAPFSESIVFQDQNVKRQEKTLRVVGLSGRHVFKGTSPGCSIWWPGIRTLPRSLQPEASGPGTGICTLNALEEPGRWPLGGDSWDSCFLSQLRGPFGLCSQRLAERRCAGRGVPSGSPSPAGRVGHPCSLEPPGRGPSPAPPPGPLTPLPGPQSPSQHGLSSGSPPLQITVEGPRGAVPAPDSPSDSRHLSPPPQ